MDATEPKSPFSFVPWIRRLIRLGYSRKGFVDMFQSAGSNEELKESNVKNTFDYLNLDLLGKIRLNQERINPYIIASIQTSYLLKKDMEESPDIYTLSQYPDFAKYEKFPMSLNSNRPVKTHFYEAC